MANEVRDIVDGANALALATLGSPWKELRWLYDLPKNDGNDAQKAYGTRPLEAAPRSTVLGYETLEHKFDFILSDVLAKHESDTEVQDILDTLYEKHRLIWKEFVRTKLNLPTAVLLVDTRTPEAPVILNMTVYLRVSFVVTYRQSLS